MKHSHAPLAFPHEHGQLQLQPCSHGTSIDTTPLRKGDLLLVRDVRRSPISAAIESVQLQGGYHTHDSRWTHAALYIGQGELIEADVDGLPRRGAVRASPLAAYCHAGQILRFRRPKLLLNDAYREHMVAWAMAQLDQPYSIGRVYLGMVRVRWFGYRFHQERRRSRKRAVTCSAFYADAHAHATRRILADCDGSCMPALLSASNHFEDIEVCQRA